MEQILQDLLINDPLRFALVVMGILVIGLVGRVRAGYKVEKGLQTRLEKISHSRDQVHEKYLSIKEVDQERKHIADELIGNLRSQIKVKNEQMLSAYKEFRSKEKQWITVQQRSIKEVAVLKSTVRIEKKKVAMLERHSKSLAARINELEGRENTKDKTINSLMQQLQVANAKVEKHLKEIASLEKQIKKLEGAKSNEPKNQSANNAIIDRLSDHSD